MIKHKPPIRRGERFMVAEGCRKCGGYGEESCRRDRSDRQSHIREGTGEVVEMVDCEACDGQGMVRI